MHVAIIDYGSGNLRSVAKAFERASSESGTEANVEITADPRRVRSADRIVLPGVGAYAACRAGLDDLPGMVSALHETVEQAGRPFFGICVGMQLMASRGLEKAVTEGLGWLEGDVVEMKPADPALKVPHIGWNTLHIAHPHPLFQGVPTGDDGLHAYFVHSYHFAAERPEQVVAVTKYGGPVTAFVARDNMVGSQFHPEKSQKLGLSIIANFLKWKP